MPMAFGIFFMLKISSYPKAIATTKAGSAG